MADVGAGHGALCASLAWRGFAPVIATELSPGPLRELSTNLQAWGVSEHVEVRCGRGLAPLVRGEVDVAVIAGLGAKTVLDIAEDAPAHGVRWLILQCMQRDRLVAPWLAQRGWPVRAADVCTQRRHTYTARLVEVVA
ncbi:MAG: class I SAM-dependent methyltransferase [Candidatus Dormibacteraeota bacterium]|nr:class I SAM-dependent methyltransferase [Candidatus Dormibacteraeota bacterium]